MKTTFWAKYCSDVEELVLLLPKLIKQTANLTDEEYKSIVNSKMSTQLNEGFEILERIKYPQIRDKENEEFFKLISKSVDNSFFHAEFNSESVCLN